MSSVKSIAFHFRNSCDSLAIEQLRSRGSRRGLDCALHLQLVIIRAHWADVLCTTGISNSSSIYVKITLLHRLHVNFQFCFPLISPISKTKINFALHSKSCMLPLNKKISLRNFLIKKVPRCKSK